MAGLTRGADGGDKGDAMKSSAVWWDRVEFQLLLGEADALVPETEMPAGLFAP